MYIRVQLALRLYLQPRGLFCCLTSTTTRPVVRKKKEKGKNFPHDIPRFRFGLLFITTVAVLANNTIHSYKYTNDMAR
jgi:hypothetical protein